jgi:TolB-like protein
VPSESRAAASVSIDAAGLPIVIVQPFRAIGDDATQATLALALTADLVTDLSKVAGIRVITAAEPTRAPVDAGAPATYRLSGTVQRESEHLRLNVLLADAVSGQAVWSTRLDRRTRDMFAAQDDLAQSILQMLPVQLSEAETRRLARRQTRNVEAWGTFVRAQVAMLVRRRAANGEARGLYWEAIRQDPAFARAYSGVAMTYALEYQLGWSMDSAAALMRAAELAQTSINMNPDMPEARWVMAFVRTQRREHAQALKDLDEALRLNPSYADAYALKGGIQTYVGRPADAVPLLRQALRLNPGAGSLYFLLLGRAYYFLADQELAQVNLGEALARNPQSIEAHLYLAATKALAGDAAGARWQADEVRALDPRFRVRAWLETYPLVDSAQRERLQTALEAIGL